MSMQGNDDRFREFEDRLRARRLELREAVQAGLHAMGEENYALEVGDVEDDALATWMESLQVADLRHDTEEVNDIDAALLRIRNGDYGTCVDCGDAIPVPRLRAYPTAKRCLACQELHEQQRRKFR